MNIGFDAERAYHNETGLGNYSRTVISGLMKLHPESNYHLFSTDKPLDLPYFNRSLQESGASWKLENSGFLGKYSRSFGWGSHARKQKLDIYHGLSNEIPLDLKPGKTKIVVTIHDLIFKRYPETYKPIDRWIYDKKSANAATHADLILATSEQTKADIEGYYPQSIGKIKVAYQDVDPAFHFRKRPEAVAKNLYQFDIVEKPYILCVSKLAKRKNHFKLVEAYKKVMHLIPEDLVLVGSRGDAADEILNQLGDLEGRLRWLGQVETDNLVNLYDGCSFTVYPSFFEGFGIPLLESMRRGKAIVSSKGSCFQEIAGPAALYADPQSIDEIAEQILKLSTDSSTKAELEKASATEAKRFEPKKLLENIYQLYQSLL